MRPTVDIVCSVLNGAAFLPDFFRGLEAQTHQDWRLWLRDDGSTDDTVGVIRAQEANDARVRLIHVGGPKSGATRAYAWLLDHIPADARYVMFADADDVWLPEKTARSLDAMLAEERQTTAQTPVLVHTDMVVVDGGLNEIHPSFWDYAATNPERSSLRRLAVRNSAAGQTMLLNRALCDRIGTMPNEAIYHDGWCAIVAAATGRIVALRDKTVLYRQHESNSVGAALSKAQTSLGDVARVSLNAMRNGKIFRENMARTARQAAAVERLYGADLASDDRLFIAELSRIPEQGALRRKLQLARLSPLVERGALWGLGALIRG